MIFLLLRTLSWIIETVFSKEYGALHNIALQSVIEAIDKLNSRPRKCLGWKHLMKCLKNSQVWMLELWFKVFARDTNSPYINLEDQV